MALLSALNCSLMGSEGRAVSAAAKTVGKEYKKFCVEYFGSHSDAETWEKTEGTFSLQCFTSRPNIGYLIISTYQVVSSNVCNIVAKAGFLSTMTPENWQGIAKSLLVGGLGLNAEKVEERTVQQTAEELRTLVQESEKDHLQAYLLSLLQMKEEQLASKVSVAAATRPKCCCVGSMSFGVRRSSVLYLLALLCYLHSYLNEWVSAEFQMLKEVQPPMLTEVHATTR